MKKTYCSLDIETTGFDPLKDEILEVGFVLFSIEAKQNANLDHAKKTPIKITEEWSQVFKPQKEVAPNIFGLTGITTEELKLAPNFSEHQDFLQSKLGNAVIVGHNVGFDIKFLEAQGLKFSGEVIDTLDLVQFILPTHHSYNLENLMHVFSVSHPDAHRALGDSKAALVILEKLLGVYSSFPPPLKAQILQLTADYNLPWKALLEVAVPALKLKVDKVVQQTPSRTYQPVDLTAGVIYNFPLGKNCVEDLVNLLENNKQKVLLVVPKMQQVVSLWENKQITAALLPEFLFNKKKFAALLLRKNLSLDETKFILKVLVWKHTNWQQECILDLNLSFFGGQFKSLINGGKLKEITKQHLVCTDLPSFLSFSDLGLYKKRLAVIVGLNEFEVAISSQSGVKVSWRYIIYLLRSFYNPETKISVSHLEAIVTNAISAVDSFFGLVGVLVQKTNENYQYFKVNSEVENSENYRRIKVAAENFVDKLKYANNILDSKEIENFVLNLEKFFISDTNMVKWIELAENRCIFYSQPLNITQQVKQVLKFYKDMAFADSLGSENLLKYFIVRLGLEDFTIKKLNFKPLINSQPLKQGELFHETRELKVKPRIIQVVKCHYQPQVLSNKKLLSILANGSLPAAVLFGSTIQLREFYEQNYQDLKSSAFLLAQHHSGGSNKIFRNFAIHPNSMLLATDKFILKNISSISAITTVESLPVKTLILCHLPFEQFTHPYQEALAGNFQRPFEEFSLPRALYNFHSLLHFFITPSLENIYVCDSKLAKDYARVFREYIKSLPRVEIVE